MKKFAIGGLLVVLAIFCGSAVWAQSVTAGDIRGVVTDATGAVIPSAKVTVTNTVNGDSHVISASDQGSYRVSLLVPGAYTVSVTASGFSTTTSTVSVAAGDVSTYNVSLSVGRADTVVEVTGSSEIINTENADVTTAFTEEQVQALPNPGNDLSYVAQTAPGTVMNTGTTAGGYGNFSSFGISGLSNMFTLDGGYENDPFLNLNNTGASNLTLGNNEVETVTVVAPAFSAQYGGLGGAQVNEITASGGKHVHGNLSYYWDGRALNANDWFNKQSQAANGEKNLPTFVNANQWAARIGGPIVKDKLFFFVNTEGIRAITPQSSTEFAPSTLDQNCALGNDNPNGTYATCATLNAAADADCATNPNSTCVGQNDVGYIFAPAAVSERPLLQQIFNTYNNTPLRVSPRVNDPNDVTQVQYFARNSAILTEWLLTARVDYKIGEKDNFFIHYKQDKGIQPTWVDLVSPLFSASSSQPAWEGQMSETHTFTPNLVNQLVVTGNYYSAPFQNSQNYQSVAPFSIVYESGDQANLGEDLYGGEDFAFPQGRKVSGYQVVDDLSYTKGRNTIRFGYNIRRDNVTDIQGIRAATPELFTTEEGLTMGAVDVEYAGYFPKRSEQPISLYNEGAYVEESFKILPNLTITAGLRVERNSNPVCHTDCFQDLALPVASLATGTASAALPYNAATAGGGFINAGRYRAFAGKQKAGILPRISFNFQPFTNSKTVIRGGFGMFTDSPSGLIADDLLSNAPTNFHGIVYGPLDGGASFLPITPSSAGSGEYITQRSNTAFQNSFITGGNYTTTKAAVAATGAVYSAPAFTTPALFLHDPTYEEWSLALEQQLGSKTSVIITYAGNHGYHELVEDGQRNLTVSGGSANYFPTVPTTKPVTAFGTINNFYSGANSNFNGVVFTAARRAKNLAVQFNYEFSKALDEVSNGGLEPFAPDAGDAETVENSANLGLQYGPADYNVKHNVTGNFVYDLPSITKRFHNMLGGFQFSGDVFHNSGLPYTVTTNVTSNPAGGSFSNGGILLMAKQLNNSFDHHCGGGNHAYNPAGASQQCNFASSFAGPTNFGQQGRNSLVGPSYTNVNFGAFKTFGVSIPYLGGTKLKLGAQFFNVFNHPNFQNPTHVLSKTSGGSLGLIEYTVGAPTSILGSVGAADASPRLIQLHGEFTF